MKQQDKNAIFHSVITSERHRKIGYCEPSDFGQVELIKLSPDEKVLIASFKRYSDEPITELIEYNKLAYKKVDKNSHFGGMGKDITEKWLKLQGKYTDKTAIQLMLELRSRAESTFSSVGDINYLIIGRTLYQLYCEVKRLKITVCGNLSFSCWLSVDIECEHGGKSNFPFSQKSFQKVLKEKQILFDKSKPKKGTSRGDGHVHFSYPKQITWGTKYK